MSTKTTTVHTIPPRPGHQHTHTIIFLHGRDSTAPEFAPELFESESSPSSSSPGPLTLPDLLPTIRWVFPAARVLHSERFDTPMSQWFDMWSVEQPQERSDIQTPGLRGSADRVLEVVREEMGRGVPRERIFLAGISQGFATAVTAFLPHGGRFAGLVGLCSWMPFADEVEGCLAASVGGGDDDKGEVLKRVWRMYGEKLGRPDTGDEMSTGGVLATPVFLGHAVDDDVVPVGNGERMKNILSRILGQDRVEWHEYQDGGHWLNEPQGVDDLVAFIRANM